MAHTPAVSELCTSGEINSGYAQTLYRSSYQNELEEAIDTLLPNLKSLHNIVSFLLGKRLAILPYLVNLLLADYALSFTIGSVP